MSGWVLGIALWVVLLVAGWTALDRSLGAYGGSRHRTSDRRTPVDDQPPEGPRPTAAKTNAYNRKQ